jgi:hypothetical protein
MSLVRTHENHEASIQQNPRLMAAIGQFGEELFRQGKLVQRGRLLPSAHGARIRAAAGTLVVNDGPFAEAKELVGGYAILQADTKEEAIAMTRRFLQIHLDILGPSFEVEIELREMAEDAA